MLKSFLRKFSNELLCINRKTLWVITIIWLKSHIKHLSWLIWIWNKRNYFDALITIIIPLVINFYQLVSRWFIGFYYPSDFLITVTSLHGTVYEITDIIKESYLSNFLCLCPNLLLNQSVLDPNLNELVNVCSIYCWLPAIFVSGWLVSFTTCFFPIRWG